jgi:hypothetical protein
VIRANDENEFFAAVAQLAAILHAEGDVSTDQFLVEDFCGPEVAFEGLLTRGQLRVLAAIRQTGPARRPVL